MTAIATIPMQGKSAKRMGADHWLQIWARNLSKTRAEELLDWREAQHGGPCLVTYKADKGFVIWESAEN